MKKSIIVIWLALPLCDSAAQNVKKLMVEPNHSTIEFAIGISNGLTRVTGKFMDFEINLNLVDSMLTKSDLQAVIKTNSITTGIPDRDEHLRSEDFFDVAKYPEIRFISDRIRKAENGYVVEGKLNFNGIEKSVDLPLEVNGVGGKNTIGFSSRFSIKRSDYHLGTSWAHSSDTNFLSDEVHVSIDFWTRKAR